MNESDEIRQIGRNSPCLCGSGKKFKNCCIHASVRDGQNVFRGRKHNEKMHSIAHGIHAAQNMPCILCGGKPDLAGIFMATTEDFNKQIGGDKGRMRAVVYPICIPCKEKPDVISLIEDVILKNYKIGKLVDMEG